jgi:hypothetical protein
MMTGTATTIIISNRKLLGLRVPAEDPENDAGVLLEGLGRYWAGACRDREGDPLGFYRHCSPGADNNNNEGFNGILEIPFRTPTPPWLGTVWVEY